MSGLYIFAGTRTTDQAAPNKTADASDNSTYKTSSEAESAPDTSSAAAETSEAETSDTDKPNAAGSVVGTGTMVGSCVGSAAIGALICFLIVRLKRRNLAA